MVHKILAGGRFSNHKKQSSLPYRRFRMTPYFFPLLLAGMLIFGSGCASLLRAVVPDSPRPNEDQLKVASKLSSENVSTIANLQTNKQNQMASVARAAIHLVNKNPEQAEAITNIAANAIKGIENADGTRKTLGALQGRTMEDVLRMPTSQFLAGIAAQTYADVGNKESLYSGIKAGWQWGKGNLGMLAGLATMIPGLGTGLGIFMRRLSASQQIANDRSDLLREQASAIENWKKDYPDDIPAWNRLKVYLTAVHSSTPLDVPKELGIS